MEWIKRMSKSIWGPSLERMRELYLSSVRPIISYACPVWFVLGNSASRLYQTKQKLIHELRSLQSECLAFVAGAFRRTSSLMLHKELFVMPIAVYLHQLAMAHFAFLASHPYRASYVHAKVLAGNTLPEQPVTQYIKQQARLLSASLWRAYLSEHTRSKTAHRGLSGKPVALSSPWGPNNFRRYRGLSRAQSTIFFQCRTGFIGLNSYLHPRKLAETSMCPCGLAKHTVEHLFLDCPLLAKRRKDDQASVRECRQHGSLYKANMVAHGMLNTFWVRKVSIAKLLNDFPYEASMWAIHNFGLGQFEWTDVHMLNGPSIKHPDLLFAGT
ncbi:Zinc knuckle [Colletotrichum scovillei]|uniref:Zinc knuckle n=1 Tax=Colletotrichum scovillei TaxID=1209932 RepID=A0A9P7QY38_9PEZI|nr:Zinc knuckle [Colletotrichum scovillei]KAG7049034.1 Zinc knuckle [Colletotrichum scovillei]KAG7063778.1 Zinc knuckle [Colletotrichum scovillei]